jgi:hypothetical protein
MLRMMTCPVILMFMQKGWLPVFCMKNTLMQVDQKWGLHGCKLVSCNLHGKSFLALVGIINAYNQTESIVGHIGNTCNGAAVTTKDLQQAAAL